MATITSTGLGSGIEVNTIVPQLVAAERKATDTRLATQEATIQAKISSWGSVKGAFSDLKSSLLSLKLPSTFQKATANSSDSSSLGVTAASNADTGKYNVEVQQLAQQHTLASMRFDDPNAIVGNGTLTIKFGATDYDAGTDTYNGFTQNPDKATANITIDSSNNTLTGVRDAINAAGIGVTASLINDGEGYRLVMSTDEGGADNRMQISVADSDGNHTDTSGLSAFAFNASATNSDQTLAAQDANLKINGVAVTSSTNSVSTALKGVTLNLLQAQPGKSIQVDIARDDSTLTSALETFIGKYNDLNSTVTQVAGYDTTTKTGGVLQGDALVRNAMSQVRNLLGSSVQGLSGSITSLVDIGIRTQSDGSLELDSAKLNEALTKDRDGVADFSRGLMDGLDSLLDGLVKTNGAISSRTEGLQQNLTQIEKDRAALNLKMEKYESRLYEQFNSMDLVVAKLQSTSNYLTQQLSNLPYANMNNN